MRLENEQLASAGDGCDTRQGDMYGQCIGATRLALGNAPVDALHHRVDRRCLHVRRVCVDANARQPAVSVERWLQRSAQHVYLNSRHQPTLEQLDERGGSLAEGNGDCAR